MATFPLALAPGSQQSLTYGFPVEVEGDAEGFLEQLAAEHDRVRAALETGPSASLSSRSISPAEVALVVGATAELSLKER